MRRYLVVDDNQPFAENMAEILADAGAQADVALSGAAALERVAATRYDALLSDMRMPVMGGAELVGRARRLDRGLPAVVLTAYAGGDEVSAARREGLLAVLSKPTPVAQIISLLSVARRDGTIALVEDDMALADNLSEALRARGFATITAASLPEAERLGNVSPFAALVDLRVPGGPDGAAMSVVASKYRGLPMLVITAHSEISPPEAHQGLFKKPFSTDELLASVERLHESRP